MSTDRTVALEGEQQFMYIVNHFKSTLSETFKTMEDRGQDMAWFYNLDESLQRDIKNDEPWLTDYLQRGE